MSSGSLGQGLSCGIGIQLAAAADPEMAGACTFVLMGDGESQEGQVWEAALYGGARKVRGIVAIVDMNGVQLASTTAEAVSLEPIVDKWKAFGWTVIDVDGHALGPLVAALALARALCAAGPVCGRGPHRQGQGRVVYGKRAQVARQPGPERRGTRFGPARMRLRSGGVWLSRPGRPRCGS